MLKGKVAIVTGGTRGIGLAIVKTYLENGAKVAIAGSRQETVDKALSELSEYNDSIMGIWPNLCSPEEVEKGQAKCSFCNTKIEWKQDKKKGSQELLEEINSHLAVIEEKSKYLRSDVAILTGIVLVQLVVILFLTIYIFSNLIS